VFRTTRQNATRLVQPKDLADNGSKKIGNELIVQLKPGAHMDDLARALGAKVIGHIDGMNLYRLQFSDDNAADVARGKLTDNPDVAGIDNNFSIDPPPT